MFVFKYLPIECNIFFEPGLLSLLLLITKYF